MHWEACDEGEELTFLNFGGVFFNIQGLFVCLFCFFYLVLKERKELMKLHK